MKMEVRRRTASNEGASERAPGPGEPSGFFFRQYASEAGAPGSRTRTYSGRRSRWRHGDTPEK